MVFCVKTSTYATRFAPTAGRKMGVLLPGAKHLMAYEIGLGSERLCTIKQIAERSALGAGTVHRALKGSALVSPETRRLVFDTVRLLNEEKIARAARIEARRATVRASSIRPIIRE